MKRIAPIVIACLLAGATAWLTSSLNVLAGFGTVNYVTSGTATFQTTTNSSGQNLAAHTLWDAVAGQFGLSIDQPGRAATSASQVTSPWFVNMTQCGACNPNGPTSAANSSPIVQPLLRHAIGQGLVNVLPISSANLSGYNCSGIQGGAAGYCVAYNATAAPTANALVTSANVLDVCYFDTTSRGCSLQHNGAINFPSGAIIIYMTTGATPFTFTTGTATGFISADVYN